MMTRRTAYPGLVAMLLLMLAGPHHAAAQQWQWPEKAENLKVLPEDTPPERLSALMRGFTAALGVRCQHCHDDRNGRRLSEMDFASDYKPAKETARLMIRMVQDLNGTYLAELDVPADQRVAVTCVTCHRGQQKPRMLEDVLVAYYGEYGLEETLLYYRQLREEYYGGFTYDFSEPVLRRTAELLMEQEQPDAALAMLTLNLEMYPDSWMTHVAFGQVYAETGDTAAAIEHLEKAQAMNPAPWIQEQLDRLKGQ